MSLQLTRDILLGLDGWLHQLAEPILPLVRVSDESGNFHWEAKHANVRVLLVAKSVRMVSGINAAMFLADSGFVVESACLLRLVGDFADEIIAMAEGLSAESLTQTQAKFVEQFFAVQPVTPAEYDAQAKVSYVTRRELSKAQMRLAQAAGVDFELMQSLKRFLNKGYDGYVHGAYLTSTELYDEVAQRFRLNGVDSQERISVAHEAVFTKIHEVISALEFCARVLEQGSLYAELIEVRRSLDRLM